MTSSLSLKKLNKCICCDTDVSNSKYLFKKGNASYFICNNCNVVFQNPQPVYELTEEIYDGEHYHERYIKSEYIYLPTSRIYLKDINKEFKRIGYYKKNLRLMDVGCGIGYFLDLAKKDDYLVQGSDISKWAGIYAKEKFNIDVITGNFLEFDFGKNIYDVVTLWQTIEHLPDPNSFLKKIYEILKPGGFICIATPDTASWIARFYKKYWNCYMPDEHICLFNNKSMTFILKKNGFSPVTVKRIHEREFLFEQIEFIKLFTIRVIKNIVLRTKIFKPLFPNKMIKKWEMQTDLEIPLPSIAYSVFAIGKKPN